MKLWGVVLLIGGVIVALGALLMTTTISTEVPGVGLYASPTYSEVYNSGLLRNQAFVFEAGLAVTIVGSVLLAAGTILERLGPAAANDDPAREQSRPTSIVADRPTNLYPEMSEEELALARKANEGFMRWTMIFGAGVLAFIVILIVATSGSRHEAPAAAAIERNTEMLADNLEQQADNLEALADNTAAPAGAP